MKKNILTILALFGLSAVAFAVGSTFPYYHHRWLGTGTTRNTEQFSIQTPSAGASAIFVPGVTDTNALGSTALRFSNVYSVLGNYSGAVTFGGGSYAVVPATETIASGGTITANGCGGMKRISAATSVTTDTTLTFTTPSSSNSGCIMDIVNVSTLTITLDTNALFVSSGAANVALTGNDAVRVGTDGNVWYQIAPLVAN